MCSHFGDATLKCSGSVQSRIEGFRMFRLRLLVVLWMVVSSWVSTYAGIVINEIFYHAPDDIEDLEYIELHNPGDQPVDIGGWQFTKGLRYRFRPNSKIEANGFLVLCRNPDRFKEAYGSAADRTFDQPLSNKGERVQLSDDGGRKAYSGK